jgi:hypothetical protein
LTFDPINRGSLALNGFLNNNLNGTRYDIIHGISSDGNRNVMTLKDCLEIRKELRLSGMITSLINVGVIFVGRQFNSSNDIKFTSVSLQYSYLDDWMRGHREAIAVQINEHYFLGIQRTLTHQRTQLGNTSIGPQQSYTVEIGSNQDLILINIGSTLDVFLAGPEGLGKKNFKIWTR